MLCHFAHYALFSKVNTLFCSTAYTTLFEWSRSIVSSVSYKIKEFANKVCSWTHIKHAKTYFFCCKVEVCCERAITFSIKVLWRVTNYKREGKGSLYFEPKHLQYKPLRKELLDIIQVQVAESTGQLVNFGRGITTVTFHFKKV